MSIDKATVEKVAKLARIKTTDAENEKFTSELNGILNWIEQLNDVDTKGVEPMTSVVEMTLYKREDDVTDGGYADKVTANAPESQQDYFVVPKVVE
jgi:aspartyl-tRNA(Asn)/glutamyl-tRNA(Gln) amidotransferase subunit C|tara:strand:+ start:125 stop:412 length:288 start_codon:yes stop_codon:yes gene_type:complete